MDGNLVNAISITRRWIALVVVGSVVALLAAPAAQSKIVSSSAAGCSIEYEVLLSSSPQETFDAMTGDISGWWDHSFAESPKRLYIEPRPGGGFYEIFDESGDGVLHATVIAAHRGKLLRFEGPLGFAGNPMTTINTFVYEADGEGTRLKATVHAMGVMQEGWDKALDQVWHHFLVEQLKPFIESGRHKDKKSDR